MPTHLASRVATGAVNIAFALALLTACKSAGTVVEPGQPVDAKPGAALVAISLDTQRHIHRLYFVDRDTGRDFAISDVAVGVSRHVVLTEPGQYCLQSIRMNSVMIDLSDSEMCFEAKAETPRYLGRIVVTDQIGLRAEDHRAEDIAEFQQRHSGFPLH